MPGDRGGLVLLQNMLGAEAMNRRQTRGCAQLLAMHGDLQRRVLRPPDDLNRVGHVADRRAVEVPLLRRSLETAHDL